jgi:transposase
VNHFLLYEELLNLPSVEITAVKIETKSILIDCKIKQKDQICPNCGTNTTTVNQYYARQIRDLNMGVRHVYLVLRMRQFHCQSCLRYFTETLPFADLNKEYTHRQADYMFCLAKKQTYTEVAAIIDVSPKTIERLVLTKCESMIDLSSRYAQVRRLGIDEHSHRKGKKDFLCILTDLDRGTIIDILRDRKMETLVTHFQALGSDFCAQITDVSCDNWDAYITASKICFPQATLVLDRFHVVKSLNENLDTFRKELRKSDVHNPNYKRLKWILYKQYHTLSDTELDNLDLAFKDSPALKDLYFSREKFHHILDNKQTVSTALLGINEWIAELAAKKVTAFDKFVKMLSKTKDYIANYVKNYLSNAVTEGLNNLIRSVRRTAFGMTNFDHLRLRVLAISE